MNAPCALCGCGVNVESHHVNRKGMGGRGKKAPANHDDRATLCAGSGGNTDPLSCHGAVHHHRCELELREGVLYYRPTWQHAQVLRSRGVSCAEGEWNVAPYYGKSFDEIG